MSGMGPGKIGRVNNENNDESSNEGGLGNDASQEVVLQEVIIEDILVCNITLKHFGEKLIEYFDILWKQNKVQWPSWTGLKKKTDV
mmetsp:Transcript_13558/g.21146  ORF Transcript_13558/g.21146 Transcript_13558/m.21146 type:complete len:86 (-) Transcript_13558:3-260(-)